MKDSLDVHKVIFTEDVRCETYSLDNSEDSNEVTLPNSHINLLTTLRKISDKINSYGAESRGIERVSPEDRLVFSGRAKVNMALLWASGCGSFSASASFFLGPITYNLSLKHSLSAAISGIAVGSIIGSFNATMGPKSGLRQSVGSRLIFGWYFSKVCAILSLISVVGFTCTTIVFGGQVLQALSNSHVPIEVGIVCIGVSSFLVAVFGIKIIGSYQKIAFFPIIICFILLYICSSSGFNTGYISSGSSMTVTGHWLSFFSLAFGTVSGWGAVASDYYILFEENTSSLAVFTLTWCGISLPTCFVASCAICIGSGYWNSDGIWRESYHLKGTGGLVDAALSRWNGGGKFVFAILFLSLVSNCALNIYSLAFAAQVIHPTLQIIPRYFVTFIGFAVALVCALVGKNHLSTILSNFLPMIGYWVTIYFCIVFIELMLFRQKNTFPLNWKDWDKPKYQTYGIGAGISFVCGVVGAIMGMSQAYYTGPIASLIGEDGADVGIMISFGFTILVYPLCRIIELKRYKK